ncbi:MAG: AbrB/MazE/SpoVT family DNA-binding domain-containing protein [Verrucomicrobiota bacterium]
MTLSTIKVTSKRQVTFPAEVCESLGVKAGDELELVPVIDEFGEKSWNLRKADKTPERPWIGRLSQYASNVEDHSMEAIRESISNGRISGKSV